MAAKLETVVWNTLLALLQHPALVLDQIHQRLDRDGKRADQEQALQRLSARITRAEGEEARLIVAYKQGVIDLATLQRERDETRTRLVHLYEERDKLTAVLQGWMSRDSQHAAVERLTQEILALLPDLPYERRCAVV